MISETLLDLFYNGSPLREVCISTEMKLSVCVHGHMDEHRFPLQILCL